MMKELSGFNLDGLKTLSWLEVAYLLLAHLSLHSTKMVCITGEHCRWQKEARNLKKDKIPPKKLNLYEGDRKLETRLCCTGTDLHLRHTYFQISGTCSR